MDVGILAISFYRALQTAAYALAVLIGMSEVANSQGPDKSYTPQASVVVTIQDVGSLLEELRNFASENKFEIANFPKPGQERVNFTITTGPDTFFYVHNFVSRRQFSIAAYSNDKPGIWRSHWESLISRLKERLGRDRVLIRRAPSDPS